MLPELLVLAPDGTWTAGAAKAAAWDAACWYVFTDPQAEHHPDFAAHLHRYGTDRPDVDIVYGDEVIAATPGRPPRYVCKPSFDETQLIAQDYIGLPVAVRGPAMAALTEFGTPATWAQIYEMLLRARVAGLEIDRITQALTVNPPEALRATVADRMAALRRVFAQSRPDCDVVPGLVPSSLELRRRFDDPPHVTIAIVPGRKPNGATAADLLRSLGRTDWPMDRLHVIVADDTASRMERAWPFDVRTAVTEHLQTQVARANQLWHACQTEQLIFLDEGLLVHEPRWLHALLTFAVDEGVGGVGARLRDWYASNGFPANPDDHTAASVHRECSMVSCEAFATKRSVLEQVNGLDERFGFANSVADLCLRLRLLGMRVVCTPHAGFAERDSPPPEPDETALFLQKWHDYLAHDPASHPRLEHSRFEGESDLSDDDWWRQRLNKRLNSPPSDTGGTGGTTGVSGAVHVE